MQSLEKYIFLVYLDQRKREYTVGEILAVYTGEKAPLKEAVDRHGVLI